MNNIDFIKTDFEDLSCHTGATWHVDILLMQKCSNIPNNLTGYSARMNIFPTDETVITGNTGATGITGPTGIYVSGTIDNPIDGSVSFLIPASETENYAEGIYDHHIELLIDSTVQRIGSGKFEVSR